MRVGTFVLVLSSLLVHATTSTAAEVEDRDPLGPSTLSLIRCVDEDSANARPLAGSRSVGTCQDGYLYDAAELPVEGDGYGVIPSFRERHLNFGSEGLVGLVQRVARRVAEQHPGGMLAVGNLSGSNGGPIRYSRSHQSGRDVDFAFYAVDAQGKPASIDGMPHYRCSGRGRELAEGLRFDTVRNWALIEALLTDERADVEVIFVSRCLKRRLLDHARAQRVPRKLRERAATVMRDAGDRSYRHDDHFHVRIYCSAEDLALGCRNDPRVWPWTRVHEGTRLRDGKRLRRRLARRDPMERVAALQTVTHEDLKDLGATVARMLDDADRSVAMAAEAAVRRLASPGALAWIRRRARGARSPEDAARYLKLMAHFEGPAPASSRFLERVLDDPSAALSCRLRGDAESRVLLAAAEAAAFLGRRASITPLVRLLSHDSGDVRAAAERALAFITNHVEQFGEDATPRDRRRQWWAWWQETRHRRWDRVLREGFVQSGVDVPRRLHTWGAVRPLYRAIAKGGYLSWNAQRLLRHFAWENSPRIPHGKPELSQSMWKAWILSRLPTGAQI